jgi:hypothetical protein
VAILKADSVWNAISIYLGGAADAQDVGLLLLSLFTQAWYPIE